MEYVNLTAQQRLLLVNQRVTELEADHYRNVLVLAETLDTDEANQIISRQAEIARRIAVHLGTQAPASNDEVPAETEATQ